MTMLWGGRVAAWQLFLALALAAASIRSARGAHIGAEPTDSGELRDAGSTLMRAVVGAGGSVGTSRMMRAEHHAPQAELSTGAGGSPEGADMAEEASLGRGNTSSARINGSGSDLTDDLDAFKGKLSEDVTDSAEDSIDAGVGDLGMDNEKAGDSQDMEIGSQIGEEDTDSLNLTDMGAAGAREAQAGKDSASSWRIRRSAKPVDCVWGQWGAYEPCTKSCGWGRTHRVRKFLTKAVNGGRKCIGSAKQIVSCKYRSCPVQCKWGTWGAWTRCGKTCGGGNMQRARGKVVVASDGGKDCMGSDRETKPCNTQHCPVLCEWAPWGPWSDCQRTCGGGVSMRDRGIKTTAKFGGSNCTGPWIENKTCNTQLCPVHCDWDKWGSWGKCTKTCGNGTTVRTRKKKVLAANGGKDCEGDIKESTSCNAIDCPVNCKWGNWGAWSLCSATCGKGERSHTRKRLVQAKHGGADCSGPETATEHCNTQPCPVDCSWETWGNWSSCSKTCGGGLQSRTRRETPAKFGGLPCSGSAKEDDPCNTAGCPVDCKWSHWSPWENCTVSCGGGITTRKRTVVQAAAWGGKACSGTAFEEDACNIGGCAVDCQWGEWEAWLPCTQTCGTGHTSRSRKVTVEPMFGGKNCTGGCVQNVTCNTAGCPVDCKWGQWTAWTTCTATCGNGTTSKTRHQEKKQAYGGANCTGPAHVVTPCHTEPCPVDCEWGNWETWTKCTATCGGGTSTRSRSKVKKANDGGRDCVGEASLKRECNAQPCPVNCKWEEWGPWSGCSVTCGVGVKRRARPKLEEQYGGKTCTGSGTEDGECIMTGSGCPDIPLTSAPPTTHSTTGAPVPTPVAATSASVHKHNATPIEVVTSAPTAAPIANTAPVPSEAPTPAPGSEGSPTPAPNPNVQGPPPTAVSSSGPGPSGHRKHHVVSSSRKHHVVSSSSGSSSSGADASSPTPSADTSSSPSPTPPTSQDSSYPDVKVQHHGSAASAGIAFLAMLPSLVATAWTALATGS